jgi:preflagellin peptidase FlaK
MVPIILAKIIALVVLVCIPIVLMILFIRYQAEEKLKNTVKETRGAQSKPTAANISKVADDPDELEVPDELIPIIQRLKLLNILMSVGLIIFGFLLIIYYSVFLELPSIILQAFAITIWLLIFYGFYNLGLPRGGADTKALMVLMILFPIYPILQNITLQTPFLTILTELSEVGITYIFPFAFTVFINAALIMLFVIFSLLIYNSSKHNLRFPHALLGYKMNIREIPNKFVWPLERLVEGKRKFIAFPIKDEEIEKELEKFRASGISKIWVTPKIPFIVPITLGIILTVIMGNLLFEIVLALV